VYRPDSEFGNPRWVPPPPGNAAHACSCIGLLRSKGGERRGACLRVSADWILTAHHIIDIAALADRFEVTFGHVAPGAPVYTYRLDAARGFHSSLDGIQGPEGDRFELDYAFVRLKGPYSADDPSVDPRFSVDHRSPIIGSRAYIPRFRGEDPLRVEDPDPAQPAAGTFTAAKDAYVFHRSATLPGVSGSPIFNQHWQLIGVHTHGVFPEARYVEGRSSNWGTHIINIVLDADHKQFDLRRIPKLKALLDLGVG
jgi:hypothetical protein